MKKSTKIRYVASVKNDKKYWGSVLISWGTSFLHPELKPVSHLCIVLRDTLVIESVIKGGVRIIPYSHWKKTNTEVYSFSKEYEGSLSSYIPEVLEKTWGKKYDFRGILYFSWRMLLYILLKIDLPKVNPWEEHDKRFCVEIFGEKLSMISPIQMVAIWLTDPSLERLPIEGQVDL